MSSYIQTSSQLEFSQSGSTNQFSTTQSFNQVKEALEQAIRNTTCLFLKSLSYKISIQEQCVQVQVEDLSLYDQIQQALREGNEDLAIEALLKKKAQRTIVSALETHIEQQSLQMNLLEENLTALQNAVATLEIQSGSATEKASSSESTDIVLNATIAPIDAGLEDLKNQLDPL